MVKHEHQNHSKMKIKDILNRLILLLTDAVKKKMMVKIFVFKQETSNFHKNTSLNIRQHHIQLSFHFQYIYILNWISYFLNLAFIIRLQFIKRSRFFVTR